LNGCSMMLPTHLAEEPLLTGMDELTAVGLGQESRSEALGPHDSQQ
jgi:hypothetical protein